MGANKVEGAWCETRAAGVCGVTGHPRPLATSAAVSSELATSHRGRSEPALRDQVTAQSPRDGGAHSASAMRPLQLLEPWVVSLLAAIPVLLLSAPAWPYPWMIRHDYEGCATCHADPSGGETLTAYGRAQGELLLRMRYGDPTAQPEPSGDLEDFDSFDEFDSFDGTDEESRPTVPTPERQSQPGPETFSPPGFLWSAFRLPETVLLGGSLRVASLWRPFQVDSTHRFFPMQADLYGVWMLGAIQVGGSIGASRVPAGSEYARRAQLTTNQGDGLNAISRTHWLGLEVASGWLVRGGRLNLPFGLRIPEHVMWVRSATQTDRESDQQHGVGLSYTGAGLRGELMAVLGNYQVSPDGYRERGYAGFAELILVRGVAVGVSSLLTHAEADVVLLDERETWRQAHGAFVRWVPTGRVAVLGEANALLRSRRDPGYVGFLQTDYEPLQGLHVVLTGEVLDLGYRPDPLPALRRRRPGNGAPRLGGWLTVAWFFFSQLDLRIDGRYQQPYSAQMEDSSLTVLTQLHAYL